METFHLIQELQSKIKQNPFPGLVDLVPAYTTLTVFFNIIEVSNCNLEGDSVSNKITTYLQSIFDSIESNYKNQKNEVSIPVYYGEEFGPDLQILADVKKITPQEVIKLHSEVIYQVFMLGFLPGFAYMGGLNPLLNIQRKNIPRQSIPSGSIGIAGNQTGIYPLESPGGWQIIGRTPLKMFDFNRAIPAFLQAGDQVKFKSISLEEYHYLYQINHAD